MIPLILASKSQARASLLSNAGLSFDTSVAQIDERAAEQPLLEAGASPADIASLLAQVKATEVSCRNPGALVIGADQTLGFGDKRFNKPEDDAAARRQLLELAGHSHQLNSAVACVKDGEILWSHVSTAILTMRPLSPQEVGHYMARVGVQVRSSVGCYQLEGLGVQLFEKIQGDYFTILGLPMLPLLGYLRDHQGLEF
ncbi:Maf family protein [uncultured Cohaesibacter sp.]|uniref:Maf family protein n=1 Tax=uncultured Cohaesibacter sp. TaxID=1002546 RepID=UPI002AA8D807|nr:Maf family protein [uncultured Cohaesibacter sp.]